MDLGDEFVKKPTEECCCLPARSFNHISLIILWSFYVMVLSCYFVLNL
jgi:hypothetical protein